MEKILIQGAMDIEIEKFVENLENKKKVEIAGFDFFVGKLKNKEVIVSKTKVGPINASVATTIAILNFLPTIVINQGIAGSHDENICSGAVIIGKKCVNINSYHTSCKQKGDGANSLEWELSKRAKKEYFSDEKLVEKYEKKLKKETKEIFIGTLGSGDIFNKEWDRIKWINNKFNTLCEEMESIGVYHTCECFNIPCIGIRIISNNELIGQKLDKQKAIKLQEMLINCI